MDMRPIVSTLFRHKTTTALIVVQIALCCAIVCNVLFLIGQRLERMQRPSGVDESRIVTVQIAAGAPGADAAAIGRSDEAALRAIAGVSAAAATTLVPFGNGAWNNGLSLSPDQPQPNLSASTYMGGEQLFDALGLKLVAGRRFLPDEFVDWDPSGQGASAQGAQAAAIPAVILTRAVAQRLFPDGTAVGKTVYSLDKTPLRVVGVVERLVRSRGSADPGGYEYAMLLPARLAYTGIAKYVLKVDDPSQRQRVIDDAAAALQRIDPSRVTIEENSKTLQQLREDYYQQDRAMALLLVAVCAGLLVVTALGIVGLASFWVQQRTRQIGVRRALGATRRQILLYFQTENFLLTSGGIGLGMLLAYALNLGLMSVYELPRLPLAYLPLGALCLWLLGQAAVLWPARRAAGVPPALATRAA